MTLTLPERAAATDVVVRRFRNRPFDWKTGATCLHLFRAQLVQMGHKPPRIPQFRSAIGAARAMERAGFCTLADVADSLLLPRIAPASMIIGDVALFPGEDGFDALVIAVGGKMLGWHGADLSRLQNIADLDLSLALGAWRL